MDGGAGLDSDPRTLESEAAQREPDAPCATRPTRPHRGALRRSSAAELQRRSAPGGPGPRRCLLRWGPALFILNNLRLLHGRCSGFRASAGRCLHRVPVPSPAGGAAVAQVQRTADPPRGHDPP